jgi:hypothetical protein
MDFPDWLIPHVALPEQAPAIPRILKSIEALLSCIARGGSDELLIGACGFCGVRFAFDETRVVGLDVYCEPYEGRFHGWPTEILDEWLGFLFAAHEYCYGSNDVGLTARLKAGEPKYGALVGGRTEGEGFFLVLKARSEKAS